MMWIEAKLFVALLFYQFLWSHGDDFLGINNGSQVCLPQIRTLPNSTNKTEYRVGVLAIRGEEAAYAEFNKTFSEYLTMTAGQRFDRTLTFKMVPLDFIRLFSDVELATETNGAEGVDFIYVNPSAFSCIESEYGANTLVSQVSRRVVEDKVYLLTKFGGVIFARADNDEINEIEDIRGKIVACADISGLGSGQMQFRLLEQKGVAYLQDPKQIIFTADQNLVVIGVLEGKYDVGFVRTDQIERTVNNVTGELIDKTKLKIINGAFPMLDGEAFPFESSTILYPEWNVGSLSHVPNAVAVEVQAALLAIRDHGQVGETLDSCYVASNCTDALNGIFNPTDPCFSACVAQFELEGVVANRCDTTPKLASTAIAAERKGKYTGFRSTLSYMELRNMQEETNFIRKQENGTMSCIRSERIVDAVVCPPGHFRKSDEQVLLGCADAGLDCGGFLCLCKPCVKSFDVDVFPRDKVNEADGSSGPCPKFAICGRVIQGQKVTFRAVDNKDRADPEFSAIVLEGANERKLEVKRIPTVNNTVEFTFDSIGSVIGVVIFQVFVDDEQIPESPFRLMVDARQCAKETGDSLRVVDEDGTCVCSPGSNDIGGKCLSNNVLVPSLVIPLVVLLGVAVYAYIEYRNKKADSVWTVKPEELLFDDPPAILGRGTFGLVLLAEYRGTQVAVKRVIPPRVRKGKEGAKYSTWRNSFLGSTDDIEFDEIPEQRQDIQLEFNEADLDEYHTESHDLDAMESGAVSPSRRTTDARCVVETSDSSSVATGTASAKRKRRASLGSMNKTDEYFDFKNLDKIQPEADFRRSRAYRRHSINTAGTGFTTLEPTIVEGEDLGTTMMKRRDSGGSLPETDSALREVAGYQAQRMPRRHSTGGGYPGTFTAAPLMATPLSGTIRTTSGASVQSDEGSLSRRGSEASFNSVNFAEFRKMIEEEEKKETALNSCYVKSGSDSFGQFLQSRRNMAISTDLHSRTSASGGKVFGFKTISKSLFGSGDEYSRLKKDFIAEMRHLSKLRHPCITTVMGAVISTKFEPMLVMEYMDHGSLYDILHNDSMIIDGEVVLPILRDIAQGVRFLHAASPKVIHGDLKAQNVLVDSKFRAKVADFGLSQKRRVGATGTPLWMAPELLRGETQNTSMSDVYSFGIILYEVYSRKDPYEGEDHLKVLTEIADPEINRRPPVPPTCPPQIASIMADCLVSEPANRPTFEELDLRLKRLDVENVEPGQTVFSMQRNKKKIFGRSRSEEILFDVFPRHIAEALRDGRKVEAESFDCVTVYFSDIVGYTVICSTLDPKKVSDLLDRLYLRFDALLDKHDIFKVETIGDAYMTVSNLHKKQSDHAARMARFAIDAVKAAGETLIDKDDPRKGYIQIRAGFHSGPIVADVVGSRSPKYSLFGDTVNTASRMESNSIPGRIQCSDRTGDLIKRQGPDIPLAARGKISVKGKGEMFTYWVNEAEIMLHQNTSVINGVRTDEAKQS